MLRPQPARWFEILVAREDATITLEALARTGAVELEARPSAVLPADLADVRPLLHQFAELSTRYRAYWPSRGCAPSPFPEAPQATLLRCLENLRAWAQDAEPLIQQTQRMQAEQAELALWREVLGALDDGVLDFTLLASAGPLLQVMLLSYPAGADPQFPEGALVRVMERAGQHHALVAGTPAQLQAIVQQVLAVKGRSHPVPAWLKPDLAQNRAWVEARLATLATGLAELRERLEAAHLRHDLHRTLGDADRLQWVIENVRALESGDLFCWVTGWSSDLDGASLAASLERSGARALLHFPEPPADAKAPLLLRNPAWARPFEVFSRALGMPSASEADPSLLLAVAVPLMFGYMFGDVGQGLVIAGVAWWLRKRFEIARLLMVGGLSAAVFGLLFGSVFSVHGLLPALWLHPLDDPLTILAVPVAGGAVLLTVGLLLGGLAAFWRGQFRRWMMGEAWLIVVYLALLSTAFTRWGPLVAGIGALGWCAGHAWRAGRAGAALTALAELVEKTLQILINTLSFARVGAFALAHAGLSSAIVALTDAGGHSVVQALVMFAGNALVLVLEAMVVSIQTTRLVLFEFFTRFLVGEGRSFRPVPAPPFTSQES
jgi:V/A-type H+-transporting ATPase subunit I